MEADADLPAGTLTESPLRAVSLLRDLERLQGSRCARCAGSLCGHDGLFSLLLGFRDGPLCFPCLARFLNRAKAELRDHLRAWCAHRDCYREGWLEASRREGGGDPWAPTCLYSDGAAVSPAPQVHTSADGALPPNPDAIWDAGTLGCGDLVLELRERLAALRPGRTLLVIAVDAGAPEDLPAWCRLTGHVLVDARHPRYRIRRKES